MSSRRTTSIVVLQATAAVMLLTIPARADGEGAACSTLNERKCGSCYVQSNEAKVNTLQCLDVGEDRVWVRVEPEDFSSAVTPLATAGCEDAGGQCTEWKNAGGGGN